MTEHERYVRDRWQGVRFLSVNEESKFWLHEPRVILPSNLGRIVATRSGGGEWILSANINAPFELSNALSSESAWRAAYEFTVQREEEIRQAEREIELLEMFVKGRNVEALFALPQWAKPLEAMCIRDGVTLRRTIARIEAHLADLKSGMKEREDRKRLC